MRSAPPFFSIITSVFNNAQGLERTIESLTSQNFKNFEHIIIDGGSIDGTQKVIEAHGALVSYWVSEKDNGIYNAWNKGLKQAKGDWICFVGSGDILYDDALAKYHQFINAHPKARYVSSKINLNRKGSIVRTVGLSWSWPKFLHYMTVAHVGSMHHKNLFDRYGFFDESYRITGDYEFLLRAGNSLNADFMNVITGEMVIGGVSNASEKVFKETFRAKTETGKKNPLIATLETWEAKCKYRIRSILHK